MNLMDLNQQHIVSATTTMCQKQIQSNLQHAIYCTYRKTLIRRLWFLFNTLCLGNDAFRKNCETMAKFAFSLGVVPYASFRRWKVCLV